MEGMNMKKKVTIRKDPFFYKCDGGLCFDYIKEIESKTKE